MPRSLRPAACLLALALAAATPVNASGEGLTFFTIGSGDLGGGYHARARAICDEVNARYPGRLRCSPETTPGSIYNLTALASGELDLALAQSDWLLRAIDGKMPRIASDRASLIRLVRPLYTEAITILARADSGIESKADLAGKRVDVGRLSSGRRATIGRMLEILELGEDFFSRRFGLPSGAAVDALCAGAIDATILVTGHPSAFVKRAVEECGASIVALDNAEIDRVTKGDPAYAATDIDPAIYQLPGPAIRTVGVTAALITRSDVPAEVIDVVLEALDADQDVAAGARLGADVPAHAAVPQ